MRRKYVIKQVMVLSRKESWRRLIPKNGRTKEERVRIYKGLVDFYAVGIYGSCFVDWQEYPIISEKENFFLDQLKAISQMIAEGDMAASDVIVGSLNSVFDPDTYLAENICAPEVAVVVGLVVGQIAGLRRNNRLNETDVLGRRDLSQLIKMVADNLRHGWVSREEVAWAMVGLTDHASRREKTIGVVDGFSRAINNLRQKKPKLPFNLAKWP